VAAQGAERGMEPGSQTRTCLLLTIALLLATYASRSWAATAYWTGEAGDGLWNTATNWREGDANGDYDAAGAQVLPGNGDTAVIDSQYATSLVVTHSSSVTTTLGDLVSEGQVVLSGGTMDFTNAGTVGSSVGTVSVEGGTLSVDIGVTVDSDVTVTSGAASFKKDAAINGDLTIAGGTVDVAKDTVVTGTITATGGTLTLSKDGAVDAFVVTGGSVTLAQGSTVDEFTVTGGDVTLGTGSSIDSLTVEGGSLTLEGTATLSDVTVSGGS